MRMKEPYEAYFDNYNLINVYMAKTFFGGQSRIFHLKDTKDRIIPLSIQNQSDLYNGYTHYSLTINGTLEIGEEYLLFDEHCKTCVVKYSHIVKTNAFAQEFRYEKDDLGVTYKKAFSTFKLWAPTAYEINLVYYLRGIKYVETMERQQNGVFIRTVYKDLDEAKYTFIVRVNGEYKEIVDPYTFFSGPNSEYSVVVDLKSLNLPNRIDLPRMNSECDAIIYEASIRDLTSQPDIGVTHPKKFVGFTEENEITKEKNTGFSYIRSLGITHIQLMPVFDFGSVDEIYTNIFYNWGYDPMQYRCLEGSYSLDPKNAKLRVEEFANLVANCHKAGLKVNVDLVFNHVYQKETFALENLVPDYYFLMNRDGEYSNGSFCGNDIDTQPYMARKYFLNTCKQIIQLYDVDGFRFDLMGILDLNLMNEISRECKKIKPDFMIYGEGWDMPSFVAQDLRASIQNQEKMPLIGHFSDRFRETVRGSNADANRKGFSSGQQDLFYETQCCLAASCLDHVFDSPTKVINYVECHDNGTLWDKNRSCCHGESNEVREKRQTLANAMVLLAQGVPFIHCGQEFGRTKHNLDNTYNRSDNYNRVDYERRNHHMNIVEDTKALIKIRKEHACFRLSSTEGIENGVRFNSILDKVLVYECQLEQDHCIVFFNPSEEYYDYHLNDNVHVIFDNGIRNDEFTYDVQIAPYSVVVCEFGLTK
jgi:pullulanase